MRLVFPSTSVTKHSSVLRCLSSPLLCRMIVRPSAIKSAAFLMRDDDRRSLRRVAPSFVLISGHRDCSHSVYVWPVSTCIFIISRRLMIVSTIHGHHHRQSNDCKHGYASAILSIRLPVCLYATLVICIELAKHLNFEIYYVLNYVNFLNFKFHEFLWL